MSLIINGMEMPKSCDVCPFVGTNDDLMSDDYRYLYCGFPYMGQYVTDYDATRHPDCPIVPLPEKHGRLIDAEAYSAKMHDRQEAAKCWRERIKNGCGETTSLYDRADQAVATFCEAKLTLDTIPTIIESEGGPDDGN